MKAVFLAFSACLISPLAMAKDHITVACPTEFPAKGPNNKSLPLTMMETWANGGELVMPSPFQGKMVDIVLDEELNEIRCLYDKQGVGPHHEVIMRHDGQHQITIEVPKGSRYCKATRLGGGKETGFCMGPKEAVPTTPPSMFIAQPVDYTATLQGFGLRKSAADLLAEAQRQGLTARTRIEPLSGGEERTRIDIAAPNPLTILLSPRTKLSVEVRQDFPSQKDPLTGTDVIAPRLFGGSNDITLNDGAFWDRKTGVVVISQNWQEASPDNYIRLIDDVQISKESGQPLGHKKYMH